MASQFSGNINIFPGVSCILDNHFIFLDNASFYPLGKTCIKYEISRKQRLSENNNYPVWVFFNVPGYLLL